MDIQELTSHVEKHTNEIKEHGELLARLTTLMEGFNVRLINAETKVDAQLTTLIEVSKTLVRYEEHTNAVKWVIGILAALVFGIVMLEIGRYLPH